MVSVARICVDSATAGGSIILEHIERFLLFAFLGLVSVAGFVWFPSWQENVVYGFRRLFCYDFRRGKERFVKGFRRWLFFYGFRLLQDRGCLSDGNHTKNKNNTNCIRTFPRWTKYIYIYIYIYIKREREGDMIHIHYIYIYIYLSLSIYIYIYRVAARVGESQPPWPLPVSEKTTPFALRGSAKGVITKETKETKTLTQGWCAHIEMLARKLILCKPLPCDPVAETALQALIWCSESRYSHMYDSPEECFFTDTGMTPSTAPATSTGFRNQSSTRITRSQRVIPGNPAQFRLLRGGEGTADWDTAASNRSTCLESLDREPFVEFQREDKLEKLELKNLSSKSSNW